MTNRDTLRKLGFFERMRIKFSTDSYCKLISGEECFLKQLASQCDADDEMAIRMIDGICVDCKEHWLKQNYDVEKDIFGLKTAEANK